MDNNSGSGNRNSKRFKPLQGKILLLLAGIFLIYSISLVILTLLERNRIEMLISQAIPKEKLVYTQLLNQRTQDQLEKYLSYQDFWESWWDKVQSEKTTSLSPPLEAFLHKENLDGVWFYSGNYQLKAAAAKKVFTLQPRGVPVTESDLMALFSRHSRVHYFTLTDKGNLVEIIGSYMPGNRGQHGYFLTARVWTPETLRQLSHDLKTKVKLVPYLQAEPTPDFNINRFDGGVRFTMPLYDWNYRPVINLSLESVFPWLNEYSSAKHILTWLQVLFSLLILGLLYISLRTWITHPLKVMATSLRDQTPDTIRPWLHSPTEIGRLADLIDDFFQQKTALQQEISHRQCMENELRSRERFLDTLIGNLSGMVYRCRNDQDWTMEFVSEGTLSLTGYLPEELIDSQLVSYASLIHPDDQAKVWQDVQKGLEHPESPTFEMLYRIRRKDGAIRWVWEHGRFIFDSQGKSEYIEGFIRDITDWKKAEAELRENLKHMEFIKLFHETLQDAKDLPTLLQQVYTLFPQHTQVNRANILIYDLNQKALLSDNLIGITHPAETDLVSQPQPITKGISGKCFREDKPIWVEKAASSDLFTPETLQQLGIISSIAVPIHGKERILGVLRLDFTRETQTFTPEDVEFYQITGDHLGMLMENVLLVTELKTSEAAIRASENQYRQAITQIKAVPYRFDFLTDAFTFLGPEIIDLTGYTPHELDSKTWKSLIKETLTRNPSRSGTQPDAISLGQTPNLNQWEADYLIINRQGEEKWVSDTALLIRDESGNLLSSLGILQDITERKEIETRLAFLTRSMEQSPNSVMITNTLGDIVYVNPTFTKLTGYAPEEVLGQNPRILKSGKVPLETYQNLWDSLSSGNYWEGELANRKKNGDIYWESAIISPVRNKEGDVTHYAAIMVDITEKKFQDKIKTSLSTLGHKLSSLAHPQNVGETILGEAAELFGWDAGFIATWQPIMDEFNPLLAMVREGSIPRSVTVGEDYRRCEYLRQTVKEGKLLINKEPEDKSTLPSEPDNFEIFCRHTRSMMFAPIRRGEKVIGVLSIQSLADKNYQSQDLELFQILADHCAGALERTVAEDSLLQRERELSVQLRFLTSLRTIDLAIISSMDLRLSLSVILSEVLVQLDATAANILMLGSFSTEFDCLGNKGFNNPAFSNIHLRLGEGYPGKAVRERRALYIENLLLSPEESQRQNLLKQEGFIGYAVVPLQIKGEIKGVLELFSANPLSMTPQWQYFLEALATQTAIAIENSILFENLQKSNTELALAYDTTLEGWSRALDLRDQETEGHTQRVTALTLRLAKIMGISTEKLTYIRWGALLHDIGKMGIPDDILLKAGELTPEERIHMQKHTEYAFQFLYPIEYLRPALDIPYCHHEKWDGTGYPRNLKEDKIPIAARIFAVVDVWDALRYDRPYRKGLPPLEVLQYLDSQRKRHFDATVVEAFLDMMKDESLWY